MGSFKNSVMVLVEVPIHEKLLPAPKLQPSFLIVDLEGFIRDLCVKDGG